MSANRGSKEVLKLVALSDELRTSLDLIRHGFRSLQEINFGNDFYHLPHQLLASGLERFMKCYICLVHRGESGHYPEDLRDCGHDLQKLMRRILDDYFGTPTPYLERDRRFLSENEILQSTLEILTHFRKFGRYHNLDVVTGREPKREEPGVEWQELERRVLDPAPYGEDLEKLQEEYYARVNVVIIGNIERMIRAISRQFTLGGHRDSKGDLRRLWSSVSCFATMRECGTTDYRVLLEPQRRVLCKWERKSRWSRYPRRTVPKREFGTEWPFRAEEAVVECREGTFCVAYLQGYAYALNGAAKSRFNYPDPHQMGMAVLGKSVGPFIDMALALPR